MDGTHDGADGPVMFPAQFYRPDPKCSALTMTWVKPGETVSVLCLGELERLLMHWQDRSPTVCIGQGCRLCKSVHSRRTANGFIEVVRISQEQVGIAEVWEELPELKKDEIRRVLMGRAAPPKDAEELRQKCLDYLLVTSRGPLPTVHRFHRVIECLTDRATEQLGAHEGLRGKQVRITRPKRGPASIEVSELSRPYLLPEPSPIRVAVMRRYHLSAWPEVSEALDGEQEGDDVPILKFRKLG